jgi:hypothetical protein
LPPFAFSFAAKNAGISLPVTIFDFFAIAMFDGERVRHRGDRGVGLLARSRVGRAGVDVARVVAVHVGDEHDVDLAQARIVRPGDGAARVVQDTRAVRVLEDERPVLRAELAVDAAQRSHLHVGGRGPEGDDSGQQPIRFHGLPPRGLAAVYGYKSKRARYRVLRRMAPLFPPAPTMKSPLLAALATLAAPLALAATERPQDRWKLEDLYADEAAWNADYAKVEAQLKDFAKCKGQLGSSAKRLLQCFDLQEDIGKRSARMQAYSGERAAEDTGDAGRQALNQKMQVIGTRISEESAVREPRAAWRSARRRSTR